MHISIVVIWRHMSNMKNRPRACARPYYCPLTKRLSQDDFPRKPQDPVRRLYGIWQMLLPSVSQGEFQNLAMCRHPIDGFRPVTFAPQVGKLCVVDWLDDRDVHRAILDPAEMVEPIIVVQQAFRIRIPAH